MRNAARAEDGVARPQLLPAVTDLENHLAFNHVKPFLLMRVIVKRRSALYEVGMLDDEQAAARFLRHHFEEDGTESPGVRFTKPVLAG